jgi:MarR family transcriptional regulator, transcriptional regulator for hemolysin
MSLVHPLMRGRPVVRLARTARVVAQAFERAMAEAGVSASTWRLLLLSAPSQWDTQARITEAMGISGATLTHHLNALEARGLVRRWREAGNRRVQRTALTRAGEAMFGRLRQVAVRYDEHLRFQLTDEILFPPTAAGSPCAATTGARLAVKDRLVERAREDSNL